MTFDTKPSEGEGELNEEGLTPLLDTPKNQGEWFKRDFVPSRGALPAGVVYS